jgi:phage terminase large subunit-like protein
VESGRRGRIALVGPALTDVREVMIEGPSGLRSIGASAGRPLYQPSRRRLAWPNGALAYVFSAEDPDALRGPQFDGAWLDEYAAWKYAQTAFDVLQFGLRLGSRPRQAVTTTPRATETLRRLSVAPGTVTTRATTLSNAGFLAGDFVEAVSAAYGRSRFGRQELFGEILEDQRGGLWTRALVEQAFEPRSPEALDEIVVGVDPPASEGADAAACGVVVVGGAGRGADRRLWVLGDRSILGVSPDAWARRVSETARSFEADRVVVEVNQGGAMVRTVLRVVDPTIRISEVRATMSKRKRAEPVLLLYERGRVRHAGSFPALEDEMCALGAPESTARSDRVDALVWAVTALWSGETVAPQIRRL